MNELLAIMVGYLIGSIPTAYLITRTVTGKDIRRLGGGNVGFLNTLREVGTGAAAVVILVDIGKGFGAVAVAYWLLMVGPPWAIAAAFSAVVGHLWMVWLKFSGGKGMGTAVGALATLFILFGYWKLLLVFIGIIIPPLIFTKNVALSMGIGLIALPLIVWFGTRSGFATLASIALLLVIMLKFYPTALAAWRKTRKPRDMIFDNREKGRDR